MAASHRKFTAKSKRSQERIAAEIGVSTPPVREWLKRLATEVLVRLDTHRDGRAIEDAGRA